MPNLCTGDSELEIIVPESYSHWCLILSCLTLSNFYKAYFLY